MSYYNTHANLQQRNQATTNRGRFWSKKVTEIGNTGLTMRAGTTTNSSGSFTNQSTETGIDSVDCQAYVERDMAQTGGYWQLWGNKGTGASTDSSIFRRVISPVTRTNPALTFVLQTKFTITLAPGESFYIAIVFVGTGTLNINDGGVSANSTLRTSRIAITRLNGVAGPTGAIGPQGIPGATSGQIVRIAV